MHLTMAMNRFTLLFSAIAIAGVGVTKLLEPPWTTFGISRKSDIAAKHNHYYLRQPRKLQIEYRVPLFLSLHYVNYDVAESLEASEPNDVLSHFCSMVNAQV